MIRPKVLFLCSENSCRPGAFWRLKWPIENPAIANDREEHRVLVRRARDEIRERVV